MYLAQINRYDLKELKSCNNFFRLWDDDKKRKNLFKTEGDCWFEIESVGGDFLAITIEIGVFSDKKTLKQKLADYSRAYLFLSQNHFVHESVMHIYGDKCTITFLN